MRVIKPAAITPAMLVSTSATELYGAWSGSVNYALNAHVISGGRIYLCLRFDSAPIYPPVSNAVYWMDAGPSNQQAMFDGVVSTATTAANSLTVVLDTGIINSLALFGLVGTTLTLSATNGAGGPVVYSRSIALDGTIISDWYQYFFEPSVQLGEAVLTEIPPYGGLRLTLTVTGGTAAIGQIAIGTFYDLGDTQFGATASIIDYSVKTTDAYGATTFSRRAFSKRVTARLMLPTGQLNKVQRVLADLRATPCAWVGVDDSAYSPLLVYGFYRDFSIEIAYPTESYCSLEIEGLA